MTSSSASPWGYWDLPDDARVTSNPAQVVVQMSWASHGDGVSAYPDPANNKSLGAIVDYLAVEQMELLYSACYLHYLNATIRYNPSTQWSIIDSTYASPQFASTLWAPMLDGVAIEELIAEIMPAAKSSPYTESLAALNQALARYSLAAMSGTMRSVPATQAGIVAPVILNAYPAAAVLLLAIILWLYAIIALMLLGVTWTARHPEIAVQGEEDGRGRNFLELTQTWLTNPLPLLGAYFPSHDGKDVQRSVDGDPIQMVCDGDGMRLAIDIAGNESAFGIRRW